MTNDFKKGFSIGAGGVLGVLFIPAAMYLIYLLFYWIYTPTNTSLQKKEFLNYKYCHFDAYGKAIQEKRKDMKKEKIRISDTQIYINQKIFEWEIEEVSEEFIDKYILNACGKQPNRWKWQ